MKISKGAIQELGHTWRDDSPILRGCPYICTDPVYLWIGQDPPEDFNIQDKYEEVPDEWICCLKSHRPTMPREMGDYYLTRAGWEANKEVIRTAFFDSSNKTPPTNELWEKILLEVENHYSKVEKATAKYVADLKKKLSIVTDFII